MSTINVNLAACDCSHRRGLSSTCLPDCASQPVDVPCPVPLSSTLMVVMGECTCAMAHYVERMAPHQHTSNCPAHPVKVSCSISGKTWADLSVVDAEREDGGPLPAQSVVDGRLALLQALVLGKIHVPHPTDPPHVARLFQQRDAVFAALANMARAEEQALSAQRALAPHRIQSLGTAHMTPPERRPSAGYLEAYVEHLMEQVSVLGAKS